MSLFVLFFGLMSGCFLSVLVGIVGSKRRIGFGWAFLASLFLTPLVGLGNDAKIGWYYIRTNDQNRMILVICFS